MRSPLRTARSRLANHRRFVSSVSPSVWPTGRSSRSYSVWPWNTTGGLKAPFSCFHSASPPRPTQVCSQDWLSDSEVCMRTFFFSLAFVATAVAAPAHAQRDTTVYLTTDQAPKSVFPDAQIERKDVPSTPEFRAKLKTALGRVTP